MTELVTSLRNFNYMTILTTSSETVYRLLYPQTVRYLQVTETSMNLVDSSNNLISGEVLQPLYEKVKAYQRLFGRSLYYEDLSNFLRINEVQFLLDELDMNNPVLEQRLYHRLVPLVRTQIQQRFYDPLLLSRVLASNDFVYNYLQTNIGHPDESENYFNRMRIMIQQLNEHTEYVEVDSYFRIIRTLIDYIDQREISAPNVCLQGYDSYCIIQSGFDTIDPSFHQFVGQGQGPDSRDEIVTLPLDNMMISRLIKIYNDLE